ncbi:MAG: hypothetical protein QF464_15555 [Myxococcota bacterium]|nr:hypothetical protein [Myxococcota bacterium]
MVERPGPTHSSTCRAWWFAGALVLSLTACGQADVEGQTSGSLDTQGSGGFLVADITNPTTDTSASGDGEAITAQDGAVGAGDAPGGVGDGGATGPVLPPGPTRGWIAPGAAGGRLTSQDYSLWLSVPAHPVGLLETEERRLWLWAGSPRPE